MSMPVEGGVVDPAAVASTAGVRRPIDSAEVRIILAHIGKGETPMGRNTYGNGQRKDNWCGLAGQYRCKLPGLRCPKRCAGCIAHPRRIRAAAKPLTDNGLEPRGAGGAKTK